ncbi:MAG TPA: hypothetical protein VNB06_07500 [Thermoanaerobaculia bacterium]|nr:hypothetical protein [Thermoanaerobaculia bacterium]
MEQLAFAGLSWGDALVGLLVSLVVFVAGLVGVGIFVVKLPATYFQGDEPPKPFWSKQHPLLRWAGRLVKNIAGLLAVVTGLVLAMPGIPGPGLLTILVGLTLLEFPGKRRLERRIVSYPMVRGTIDRMRERYGKPPLVLEDEQSAPPANEERGDKQG